MAKKKKTTPKNEHIFLTFAWFHINSYVSVPALRIAAHEVSTC